MSTIVITDLRVGTESVLSGAAMRAIHGGVGPVAMPAGFPFNGPASNVSPQVQGMFDDLFGRLGLGAPARPPGAHCSSHMEYTGEGGEATFDSHCEASSDVDQSGA